MSDNFSYFFPATVYASNVAEVNGVEYATIQQALDAAKVVIL